MSAEEVNFSERYFGRSLTCGNEDEWNLMDEQLKKLGVDFEIQYLITDSGKRLLGKAWRMKGSELYKLPWDPDPEEPDLCIQHWGKPEAPYIPVEDIGSGHGVYPLLLEPLDWGGNGIITKWQSC